MQHTFPTVYKLSCRRIESSVGEYQWYMYHDKYLDTKKVSSIKYHDTFLVRYQYQYQWYISGVSAS